jgi:hypothetical protein
MVRHGAVRNGENRASVQEGFDGMKHLKVVGRQPALAASMCDSVTSDFAAQLCFVSQVLIQFLLPMLQPVLSNKYPADNGGNNG